MTVIRVDPANSVAPSHSYVDFGLNAATNLAGVEGRRLMPASIPSGQIYYWTTTWQAGEMESLANIRAGNVQEFDGGAEVVEWLRADE